MKFINFGSMHIDYIYNVKDIAKTRETVNAVDHITNVGGKGLNQSVALARAGAKVSHVGLVGKDGADLKSMLIDNHISTDYVECLDNQPSGHAVIQVNSEGDNTILIFGGTNQQYTPELIEKALAASDPDDIVLVQNQINDVPRIIEQAKKHQLKIIFNLAPASQNMAYYPLEYVDVFVLNQNQGNILTRQEKPDAILATLQRRYPQAAFVLTMGQKGVKFVDNHRRLTIPAERIAATDTNAGGDTFVGYFLARWHLGDTIEHSLELACRAAALCITRKGAATSIPYLNELV